MPWCLPSRRHRAGRVRMGAVDSEAFCSAAKHERAIFFNNDWIARWMNAAAKSDSFILSVEVATSCKHVASFILPDNKVSFGHGSVLGSQLIDPQVDARFEDSRIERHARSLRRRRHH